MCDHQVSFSERVDHLLFTSCVLVLFLDKYKYAAFLVRLSIRVWIITINGAEGTIYAGEKFRLRVAFPEDYPTKPPAVYFLQSPPPPKHQVGQRPPQP